MRPSLLAAIAALPLLAGAAEASTITMQTRHYTGGALGSAAAYQALIDGLVAAPATAGYGDAPPAAFDGLNNAITMGGPAGNYAAKFTIDFTLAAEQAGSWTMQFGVDFGLGGALFVDGAAMAFNPGDMWWGGSYGNAAQILQATANLSAGRHVVTLYGLEACCDGTMQARFQGPAARGWTTFGSTDGLAATPVSAPAGFGLFTLGLLGLAATQRRRG